MAKQCIASTRLVGVFVLSLVLAGFVVMPSLPSGSYATTITRDDCLTRKVRSRRAATARGQRRYIS